LRKHCIRSFAQEQLLLLEIFDPESSQPSAAIAAALDKHLGERFVGENCDQHAVDKAIGSPYLGIAMSSHRDFPSRYGEGFRARVPHGCKSQGARASPFQRH
jgi:hypothetical protein